MSLTGKTKTTPQMPNDIGQLRGDFVNWLRGNGQTPGLGGNNPYGSVTPQMTIGGSFGSGGFTAAGQPQAGGAGYQAAPPPQPVMAQGNQAVPGWQGSTGQAATNPFAGRNDPVGSLRRHTWDLENRSNGPAIDGTVFNQIFSQTPAPFNPATAEGAQINMPGRQALPGVTIGAGQQANYNPVAAAGAQNTGAYLDPRFNDVLSGIMNLGSDIRFGGANAAMVRPVGEAASVVDMSHNLSEIVNGQNDYFKNNVLNAYNPLFDQQRELAIAQAKEAAGNLTGTGYAANVGNVLNRLVPEQQARLSDILTQLGTTEMGRELQVMNTEQSRRFQNQNVDLQRALADANNQTGASIANASAGAGYASALVGARGRGLGDLASLFGGMATDTAGRTDRVNMFNADQANQVGTQQAVQNAQLATQRAIAQGQIDASQAETYFNALMQTNTNNANMSQQNNQFNAGQYNQAGMFNSGQQFNAGQNNSNRFLQALLGMTTTGVTAGQPYYQPGIIDSIGQLLPAIASFFGPSGPGTGGTTPRAGYIPTASAGNLALGNTPSPFTWSPTRLT